MLCDTERVGHARELVRELVLSNWYGIVIVSGDGLIYEVCFCMTEFTLLLCFYWHTYKWPRHILNFFLTY